MVVVVVVVVDIDVDVVGCMASKSKPSLCTCDGSSCITAEFTSCPSPVTLGVPEMGTLTMISSSC
jgi:hypothetical protein